MKTRRKDCKYCGAELTEGNTNRQFCCAKHKVYWHRENPKTQVQDLTKPTNVVKPPEPLKSNFYINTKKEGPEPLEGTSEFKFKYGHYFYADIPKNQ